MKKAVIGLSIAALILALAGVLIWLWFVRELPVLDATLSIPSEVELDTTADMVITATNSHKKAVTLDSIDIDGDFLSGFQVVSVDPKPSKSTHVPIINQRSWDFGTAVAPGGALVITFKLKAVMEGHFTGDVDVCNPNQDTTTMFADVIIKKQLSNKTNEKAKR